MKILVVSSFFPYPLYAGGYIRLYNLMRELSQRHEITLIAEKRSKQQVKPEYIKELEKICKQVIVIPTRKQWSWQNVLKAGISPYPFLLTGHTSPAIKRAIIDTIKEKRFDIIHVETFYVMQNLPKTYLPIVLAEHNVEHDVYRKYVDVAPLPLRPLLLTEIQKIKYWEKKFWQKATKLVAVSEADRSRMGREDTVVVPNGVAIQDFPFVTAKTKFARKEKRILFMGDFKWVQNIQAANWILDTIWPEVEVRSKNSHKGTSFAEASNELSSNVKLWIVGKNIPEGIKSRNGGNIIIDENAPDETAKIYQKSFVLLAPITVGGGTSYKILESMASGVPVVTTPLGVKGLGAKNTQEALVGDTAGVLAQHVVSLLTNQKQYETMQREARKLIESKYTWPKITEILERVYKEAKEI